MSIETRGFVAYNGKNELCFFPWREADGIPLAGEVLEGAEHAVCRTVELEDLPSRTPDGPENVRHEVSF